MGGGPGDRDAQLSGGCETIVGITRDPAHGDFGEWLGDLRRDLEERGRLLVHAALENLDGVTLDRERERPREELVQHGRSGVHVGGWTAGLPFGLLRRHVRGCPDHLAIERGDRLVSAEDLGDAEVGDLQGAVGREHEVLRLHVPVEHALLVGELEGLARCEQRGARRDERQTFGGETVPKRPARQRLHHEEAKALLLHVVVDGDDVGMRQRGERARLLAEALPDGLVGGERGRQLLDRDVARESPMVGREDDSHGATAELAADLVVREGVVDRVRQR